MSKRITNVKKGGSAKKILAAVAVILAFVIVVGVVVVYNVVNSGYIQRKQIAMKSDNYEVSSAMMGYFFNTLYQNSYSSYESVGLATDKALSAQTCALTGDGTTWYDFYIDMTKENVRQLLVICEAAKADGFKLEDDDSHDHSADETLKTMEDMATTYGVTLEYYLEATYGKGVNEKVFRECYELSEIASHYSEHMTESYKFTEEDWTGYYEENKDTFNKVDYLSFTFKVEETEVADDATDDEKAAAAALDKEEAARLEGLAAELGATTDADAFKTYVESYLNTDLYKDLSEEERTEQDIDIKEEVADCLTEGATNSSETDLNTWLFDAATVANSTKIIKSEDGLSFTVAMILPAESTDLDDDCLYRDTYHLKNFRYIPFLTSSYNESAEDAKNAAEASLAQFNDDPTAENFGKMADEFANTNYEGGLVEGADKGAIGDSADAWLYDSARKEGDCEIIEVEDSGYYLLYYVGDNEIKWQYQANSSLVNDKYNEEYEALEAKYKVMTMKRGISLVPDINVAG